MEPSLQGESQRTFQVLSPPVRCPARLSDETYPYGQISSSFFYAFAAGKKLGLASFLRNDWILILLSPCRGSGWEQKTVH